ncbi:MAG: hypothetical protein ACYSU0_12770 [Planctomycetota bacterium]
MKQSKRFLVAVAVGALVLVAFRGLLVSSVRGEADREIEEIENKQAKRKSYFRKGEPVGKVKKELETEERALKALESSVEAVELVIPPELVASDDNSKLSYYQKHRSMLNERAGGHAAAREITFANAKSPLGLPLVVPDEKVPEFLARLVVARRFLDAAVAARIERVAAAEHPVRRFADGRSSGGEAGTSGPARPAPAGAPTEAGKGEAKKKRVLEELPMKVVVAANEHSLIRLLQEVSRPESFLALNDLRINVKDPASGAFEATLELAGVRMTEAPEEAELTEIPAPPKRPTVRGLRKRW